MKRIKNIHPGEILKEEFLDPMGISIYKLSQATGLTQTRLGRIIHGKQGISAESALKLGKFFGVPPQFWLNLQNLFDLEEADRKHCKELITIHPLSAS